MYEITIWSTRSTDYGASQIHRTIGTLRYKTSSVIKANKILLESATNKSIERVVMRGPEGVLTWDRYNPETPEFIEQDTDPDNY